MRLKHLILAAGATLVMALPASAACYAEYRAQQQNPVQLAFGVAEIRGGSCDAQSAATYLRSALARSGWTLSNIVSTVSSNSAPGNSGYTNGHYLRF
ncbi:hypothetical protein [Pararhodobacter zhoushanensis]|uniref:hypothetical protein n=1 Tax=Pararhodobacter zhoushanensis TaxID=2479545 RepID=UPI000F8E443E|nr:hypothetical protein [Pararhodobacter zhoushanensis]